MSRRHNKKRKPKNEQKSGMQHPSLLELEKSLTEIQRLKREENRDPSDELLRATDYHIAELDVRNLNELSAALVIYANTLMSDQTGKQTDKIRRLESILKSLEKMDSTHSVLVYRDIWERETLVLLERGEQFIREIKQGSFFHFYFSYQLNALIAGDRIPIGDIVKSIVPCALPFLNEKSLMRVSLAAMVMSDSDKKFSALLSYYLDLQNSIFLETLMASACETGRFDVVKELHRNKVPLPKDIDSLLLVMSNATAAEDLEFLISVVSIYGHGILLDRALVKHFYVLAALAIVSEPDLVFRLTEDQRHRMVELASVQMDQLILKKIFSAVPENKREDLFKYHVAPYVYIESLSCQIIHSDRIINIIRYYMEAGLFTFSLEDEASDPKLFGPRACGHLCQWLAFSTKIQNANGYGVIRDCIMTVELDYQKAPECRTRMLQTLESKGQENREFFHFCNKVVHSYTVQYQGSHLHQLTQYLRIPAEQNDSLPMLIIVSTLSSEFKDLSAWIQGVYARLPKGISLFNNPFTPLEMRKNVLKDIARIIGLKAHEGLYCWGSSFVLAFIQCAMLLMYGLKGIESDKTVETSFLKADINALSFDDLEDWVQFYPNLFGVGSYEECIERLGQHAAAEAEDKIIDELRRDLLSNTSAYEGSAVTLFRVNAEPVSSSSNNNSSKEKFLPGFKKGFFG